MSPTPAMLSRRQFFGRWEPEPEGPLLPRPPWTSEASIAASCTSCGDCIGACPEAILLHDPGGKPAVDFHRGECTFCGACAKACAEPVFSDTKQAPWSLKVAIGPDCLLSSGVSCQICREICPVDAFRYDLSVRPVGAMTLSSDLCTGCGACVATCPADAIAIAEEPEDGVDAS